MCFINYVTEVHFPSREVVVMSCHSGELKKDYFAITILVNFFFYLTACVEKMCSHNVVGRSIKIVNLAFI